MAGDAPKDSDGVASSSAMDAELDDETFLAANVSECGASGKHCLSMAAFREDAYGIGAKPPALEGELEQEAGASEETEAGET